MKPVDDYHLWKLWWFCALWGFEPEYRMEAVDAARNYNHDVRNIKLD